MNKAQQTGKKGEQLAEAFLIEQGYRILGRNVRCVLGEIDVVAEHEGAIIFIEVKTRMTTRFGVPEEAVTFKKREKLKRLASWYLMKERMNDRHVRFDVLSIQLDPAGARFRLIRNAIED